MFKKGSFGCLFFLNFSKTNIDILLNFSNFVFNETGMVHHPASSLKTSATKAHQSDGVRRGNVPHAARRKPEHTQPTHFDSGCEKEYFKAEANMKYWVTTFQATGIALFAGAIIATPTANSAIFWGVWLILIGFFFHSLIGGKQL